MNQIHFIDESGSFFLDHPENTSYLYFPLASENGLKSCVTPNLGGDAKLDQDTFLLEPVSSENLHNNRSVRNFWLRSDCGTVFSVTGASDMQEVSRFSVDQEPCHLTAGFMWHTLERFCPVLSIKTQITSFIPVQDNVEIMYLTIENTADITRNLTPYAAIPIYGRSADNIRDHRNVTSMLNRIRTDPNGITVCPSLSFNEKGHHPNHKIYYVYSFNSLKQKPESFYPTVESFLGEGGTYTHPRAVYESYPGCPAASAAEGREAMGAFRFPHITLNAHEKIQYAVVLGVENSEADLHTVYKKYDTVKKVQDALEETIRTWREKVNVSFHTGNKDFDLFMKWVCFQPHLRRLFGCPFLPPHDYGRGGRGWRDLWQDCLSLLLMDPADVGQMITSNYEGIRIDGTNATIIGAEAGDFIADRNCISRVWMDHAFWPLITTRLYIHQTGDIDLLNRQVSYFKDVQAARGTKTDSSWKTEDGNRHKSENGKVITGSILEHLLIEQLTAFYETGEHNIFRLRNADWNDALDMAPERGESSAFTYAYAGNLQALAEMIRLLDQQSSRHETELIEELKILLTDNPEVYADPDEKKALLDQYMKSCSHTTSGQYFHIALADLADNLDHKAAWLTGFLGKQEWIKINKKEGWFNSYYDNLGQALDGSFPDGIHMMLTGQVFAIMGNVASPEQIRCIMQSADHYLFSEKSGGYRLNTDFHKPNFNIGRMFSFAYGEKENGSVFSHMTVMFANALYQRGFVKEGWKALKTLAGTAMDFNISRIYPGIPEYFRPDGHGMYHYLTGAASWFMLTMITQVFGVRGDVGNMILNPKLSAEQFDKNGIASLCIPFAGRDFRIIYKNFSCKDYGDYRIGSAHCEDINLKIIDQGSAVFFRNEIETLTEKDLSIMIDLI